MKIIFSDIFIEHYNRLEKGVQNKVKAKLKLMAVNQQHPSLRTKKVQGTANIFEASVNMGIRITRQYIGKDILLRNIGEHDETLKHP